LAPPIKNTLHDKTHPLKENNMQELFDKLEVIETALRESNDPVRMVQYLRQERQRVLENIERTEQQMVQEYEGRL
jgi:hypothetical protein